MCDFLSRKKSSSSEPQKTSPGGTPNASVTGSGSSSAPTAAAQLIAADNREANQQADIEARMRKRRAGAAANILTSAVGIPSGRKMGQTA